MKAAIRAKKRRHVRFNPSTVTYAEIDFRIRSSEFKSQVVGFVVNEAFGGCSVVLPSGTKFEVGSILQIKIGRLSPLRARIAWLRKLDEHITKLGLEYQEEE